MEDVASPMFIHQTISSHYCEAPMMARKRDLIYQTPNFQYQHPQYHQEFHNGVDNWSPKAWDWDSARFSAKPLESEILCVGTAMTEHDKKDKGIGISILRKGMADVHDEDLQLNLGRSLNSVEEPASRPNKRVRSRSPTNGNYPKCQVDSCTENLSYAKDYHRRHKVCEVHSKSTEALVRKQMQRFCQQCSRFHPLSEFDEGKRSCRRRLAGHNRRRRKTQPEEATSGMVRSGNLDSTGNGNLDIVNLLTALARTQGKNDLKGANCSAAPDRDQLIQILNKINSLPLPVHIAEKLQICGISNNKIPARISSEHVNLLNGSISSPSTMDLLAILSSTLAASTPDALEILSQRSSQSSDSEKTNADQTKTKLQKRSPVQFPSVGERSSMSYQSPLEDSDCQLQDAQTKLPLQLFSSSPENVSPPQLASSRKYFSSDSSNRTEDRSSPSSPPIFGKLFPTQRSTEAPKPKKMSVSQDSNAHFEASVTRGSTTPLDLFRGSRDDHGSVHNFPYQAGYTSSSGSDHSPSSLTSHAQDRTGRIMLKLFDKDPSHFPGTLRTQIYNWLSKMPSEMESYIRPGCVVLMVYVSMSSTAWEELVENLVGHVNSLIQKSDSDFWRNGRFLVHTGRQLVSHKEGRIRPCKLWRSWSSPELISVSPLAVVGGQETPLLLRGRNLTKPGTKIHCTYLGGYKSKEVVGLTHQGTIYDEINLGSFKIHNGASSSLGRCFIEVENGFKGNSFPVIVANASVCKELNVLQHEFDEYAKICDVMPEDQNQDFGMSRSSEEALHFLNELGWLFQRTMTSSKLEGSDYALSRFKFLFMFSLERDYCALVKTLLDILVEKHWDGQGLSRESLDTLSDIQLLNRAVKRRCRKMVDLLIHYSVTTSDDANKYIFPPNLVGPGGITPLHLAASTSGSDNMVDALTNDPHEIGLFSWNSLLDANGHSPYAYATMRNNHTYNWLVARKLSERKNGEISVTIESKVEQPSLRMQQDHRPSTQFKQGIRCARCAVVPMKYSRSFPGSHGLLQRPYIHSILAIAAVCVCVCLFLRGSPDIGLVAPFKWENLDFGTM